MNYWVKRLLPILDATKLEGYGDVIVAIANRIGTEEGKLFSFFFILFFFKAIILTSIFFFFFFLDSMFAGSSCVLRFRNGKAELLGYLGVYTLGLLIDAES